MGIYNLIKHYTFSAVATLSTPDPLTGDGLAGDASERVRDFVAELGVSKSIERQLVGIEQTINAQLIDLGPYIARQTINGIPMGIIENRNDCSIYDAKPSADTLQRSGALVFIKYYQDSFGVVHDPVVELVGFGSDFKSAWSNAMKLPRISSEGQGMLQKEKSYMLWYQFKIGTLEKSVVPYPFYLPAIK